jgi:hypothetical protein
VNVRPFTNKSAHYEKDKAYIFLHGARMFAAMIHCHPTLTFWGVVSSMLLRPLSIKVLYIEIFRCKLECLLLRDVSIPSIIFGWCLGVHSSSLWWKAGNTKGGSITVPLTSCLTGLELAVWQLTIFVLLTKQTNPNQSTGGQMYSDTSPFSIPCERAQYEKRDSLQFPIIS